MKKQALSVCVAFGVAMAMGQTLIPPAVKSKECVYNVTYSFKVPVAKATQLVKPADFVILPLSAPASSQRYAKLGTRKIMATIATELDESGNIAVNKTKYAIAWDVTNKVVLRLNGASLGVQYLFGKKGEKALAWADFSWDNRVDRTRDARLYDGAVDTWGFGDVKFDRNTGRIYLSKIKGNATFRVDFEKATQDQPWNTWDYVYGYDELDGFTVSGVQLVAPVAQEVFGVGSFTVKYNSSATKNLSIATVDAATGDKRNTFFLLSKAIVGANVNDVFVGN